MITKRFYLLPQDGDFAMSDLSGQFDAPLRTVSAEDLRRMESIQPDATEMRKVTGAIPSSYAPVTESVPDIPGRPTVTVERDVYGRRVDRLTARTDWLGAIKDILTGIALVAVVASAVAVAFWLIGGAL